jgi:type I restriction enzyme S subunit
MSRWPLVQLRRIARFAYGDSLADADRVDGPVPVFGSNGTVGSHNEANTSAPTIIIGRKGSFGKIQYSQVPSFVIDTAFYVDSTYTSSDLRWFYYALGTLGLDSLSADVGVPGLSRDIAYTQQLPLPPVAEQRAIADYLDIETSRIDALTRKKRQMIRLIDERREVLITASVKGQDSGIAQTSGPVKEVRPLRAYAEVALGRQRSPQHETGVHMVPYLRAANVKDGAVMLSDVKEMNFTPAEQRVFSLRAGDVLVTEGSGSLGTVGASAVWSEEIAGVVCFQNTLLRLRPHPSTDPRFLAWWCRSAFASGVFASVAEGANIFHLSAERVRALPMTRLSLHLQRTIADYLDIETARIDCLALKLASQIDLLAERRQALITAAITGGLDVPGGTP